MVHTPGRAVRGMRAACTVCCVLCVVICAMHRPLHVVCCTLHVAGRRPRCTSTVLAMASIFCTIPVRRSAPSGGRAPIRRWSHGGDGSTDKAGLKPNSRAFAVAAQTRNGERRALIIRVPSRLAAPSTVTEKPFLADSERPRSRVRFRDEAESLSTRYGARALGGGRDLDFF